MLCLIRAAAMLLMADAYYAMLLMLCFMLPCHAAMLPLYTRF